MRNKISRKSEKNRREMSTINIKMLRKKAVKEGE